LRALSCRLRQKLFGRRPGAIVLIGGAALVNEPEANAPTQVTVGRGGSLNIFTCSANPAHEHKISIQ
jgi:hypothetical protein